MLVLLLVIIILILVNYFSETRELMVNIPSISGPIKYTRNKNCNYMMNNTIKDILKKYNIPGTNNNDWSLYMPCTYNKTSKELTDINYLNPNQRIFILDNCDQITSKDNIWKNLVKIYGRKMAQIVMPTTYILNNSEEIELFNKEYTKNKLYIMKKNIQRQTGLLITNKKEEILNNVDKKYVIVQELLQDPYLINGRKINMRFYLLIICKKDEIDAYVHNDGFMYYSAEKFKKNSIESKHNITTGYIDRKIYDTNPLTHTDFRNYLNKKGKDSDRVFKNVYDLLSYVVSGLRNMICNKKSKINNAISFQLFGVDIALNDKLNPQIMELNKGPDLGTKGPRDKIVKYNVIEDMLRIMKIIPDSDNNGYIKILE
jgi:hypothetical protein